jgi:hypothetical protein
MASDAPGSAPLRKARWAAALLITGAALALYAFWLFTGAHPVCQVTTAASASVRKTCGLPDVSDYVYVLAVVVVLLLPDAKSIKIGGLEFERLTTAVREQKDEIGRLSQQVTQVVHNSQNFNVTLGAAALAAAAAEGDVPEGARPREEVAGEFLDPGSS